jgi:hypothetical protein
MGRILSGVLMNKVSIETILEDNTPYSVSLSNLDKLNIERIKGMFEALIYQLEKRIKEHKINE